MLTITEASKTGAANWTIIGGNHSDFAVLIRRLSNYRGVGKYLGQDLIWSCFRSKQGAWAISLNDDVQIADIMPAFQGLLRIQMPDIDCHGKLRDMWRPNDIGAVPHGEMAFTYDDMAECVGFIPKEEDWWKD